MYQFVLACYRALSYVINFHHGMVRQKLVGKPEAGKVQVILFEIDYAIFYTNLHELFCQFITWTNWENTGKFTDNCWISCQVMADMKKVYNNFIIISLYNNAGCPNQASLNMDQPSTSTFPSLYVRYAFCIVAIKVTNQMCIKEKMKENHSFFH